MTGINIGVVNITTLASSIIIPITIKKIFINSIITHLLSETILKRHNIFPGRSSMIYNRLTIDTENSITITTPVVTALSTITK